MPHWMLDLPVPGRMVPWLKIRITCMMIKPTKAKSSRKWLRVLFCGFLTSSCMHAAGSASVRLERTPDGGIQPQAVAEVQGTLHLIYFKGDPMAGDLFYVSRKPGQSTFSSPRRVNQQPGGAIATGTIRGAQLALGKNNRAHVVWNGSGKTVPHGNHEKTPLLYSRLNDAGDAFEVERNVITYAWGLDGGSSVTADGQGNVYVAWHASPPGNTLGEEGRAIFVARSSDDGKSFAPETRAVTEDTGACGCCGMKSFTDNQGRVYILYRAANPAVERAMVLLRSADRGERFQILGRHPWKVNTCPMSSAFLGSNAGATLAAWETSGQIYWARLDAEAAALGEPMAAPGTAKRKHPVLAVNHRGETLLVWTEGTGWNRGGAVAWQLFDRDNHPLTEQGRAEGVPVWGLAAAWANPDGSFVILF